MLKNRASAAATAEYAARHPDLAANYRPIFGLTASSIGIGTYLGEEDAATDTAYAGALRAALLGGINLIDTAVNYRLQRSERVIGAVLAELIASGSVRREQIIVATKGGYLAFDNEMPADPRGWIDQHYIKPGIIAASDLVQGSHCMTPRYLDAMIETSRRNLGLETIDIYYLHNPEAQLAAVSRDQFNDRIGAAFEFLERAVSEKRIGAYGTATWNGYRVPVNDRAHLSLSAMVEIARKVAGGDHHFGAIQLPYNLAMTEALTSRNQPLPDGQTGSLLASADLNRIAVCASASLLQGRLARGLPPILAETFAGFDSDAGRALQFVRSTPGIDVALVGMSSAEHVRRNLIVARQPPASFDTLMKLFQTANSES